jgi:broad specificity phosphatase PhoE
MPELQELLLVRHGQSTANARGIWQGQMEFPLSKEGRVQACLAGRGLSGEPFEGLYSSPLSRAFETAKIIRDRAGFEGEVVPVDGLSERNGGILEGHTWAEQEQLNPELAKKFLAIPEGNAGRSWAPRRTRRSSQGSKKHSRPSAPSTQAVRASSSSRTEG